MFAEQGIKNAVLVIDNVPFHKEEQVRSLVENHGHKVLQYTYYIAHCILPYSCGAFFRYRTGLHHALLELRNDRELVIDSHLCNARTFTYLVHN